MVGKVNTLVASFVRRFAHVFLLGEKQCFDPRQRERPHRHKTISGSLHTYAHALTGI